MIASSGSRVASDLFRSLARAGSTGTGRCRRLSGLSTGAQKLRPAILESVTRDSFPSASSSSAPSLDDGSGDWSTVRGQAAMVAAWPEHPLKPADRLTFASTLVDRTQDVCGYSGEGASLCAAYRDLLDSESIFSARSDGTAKSAIVLAANEAGLAAASIEALPLILRGYAVSLVVPAGPTLAKAKALVAQFPSELLQAAELGPMIDVPSSVHAARFVGFSAQTLWAKHLPPPDFGGVDDGRRHGMSASAPALSLARTDITKLEVLPRARYTLSDEGADLLAMLSTRHREDAPSAPGLPTPRWARSPYDRGNEEVHDLVDLLWGFSEPQLFPPLVAEADASSHSHQSSDAWSSVQLSPAPKHFVLTSGGTDIPDDIIKAAVISTVSPFHEPVVLHAVGLGSRGLQRDPLSGFCRLVESGKSGLKWFIMEHDTWAAFFKWLRTSSAINAVAGPRLFGSLRGMDDELQKACAVAGGVAWGDLFTADPLEQLRRWTMPIVQQGAEVQTKAHHNSLVDRLRRPKPEVELITTAPVDD